MKLLLTCLSLSFLLLLSSFSSPMSDGANDTAITEQLTTSHNMVKLVGLDDLGVFDPDLPLETAQPNDFKIIQTNPSIGATGVDESSSISVTFSKPVAKFSVDNNFWLGLTTPPVVLGTAVSGTTSLSSDGKTLTFTPSKPLLSGTSYTIKVKPRMQAATFEFLGSEYSSSFITGGPANPNTCNFLLAHPKTITGVTAKSSESTFPPKNAIDKNLNTKWMSTSTLKPWIKADLGHEFPVCKVDIAWADGSSRQYRFIISVSLDGTNFVKVLSGKSSGSTSSAERYSFAETNARYVRIMLSESTDSVAQISEMTVIGKFT